MSLLGAIEAGDTKFVCAVGAGPDDLRTVTHIPTTTPAETIPQVTDLFRQQTRVEGTFSAIGIGASGPVDVRPDSSKFGWSLNMPKPGWQRIDFAGVVKRSLNVAIGFDTDVNAAALGEHQWGSKRVRNVHLLDCRHRNWERWDSGWPALFTVCCTLKWVI